MPMQSDAFFAWWVCVNHLATMLYYKLFNIIRTKRKLETLSHKDLLMGVSRVFHLRIAQE